MAEDLFLAWFLGLFFSFVINILGETKPASRFAFNTIMWPLALLIVCFKGALTHLPERKPKRKKNAR